MVLVLINIAKGLPGCSECYLNPNPSVLFKTYEAATTFGYRQLKKKKDLLKSIEKNKIKYLIQFVCAMIFYTH